MPRGRQSYKPVSQGGGGGGRAPVSPDGPDFITSNLLAGETREWWAIPDLDDFFTKIYQYYDAKGLWPALSGRVVNLLTLGFTISFSVFLLLFMDWHGILVECSSEESCAKVSVIRHGHLDKPNLFATLVLIYLAIFSLWWLLLLCWVFLSLRDLLEMRRFFFDQLGISERELQTIEWADVVDRLVILQRTARFVVVKDELSPLDIANRIMRKENYLIAFLTQDLLSLRIPFTKGKTFSKVLEWNLYYCVLHYMFDREYNIRKSFQEHPHRLRNRFILAGVINLILSPFILAFMAMYFFLKYAEEFKSRPQSLGNREWSRYALWRVREFNELPHYLQRRLDASYEPTNTYLRQFPSPISSHIARLVSFIAGSFAAVLVTLSLIDSDVLLYLRLWDYNLVWYIAVLSMILAIARSFINEEKIIYDPETTMRCVVEYTHYLPKHWRNRCHTFDVRDEFLVLFPYKFVMFFHEMLSVVFTPFILMFSLSSDAERIVHFVREFTVHMDGVGHVCGFAVFDAKKYGNSRYGGPVRRKKGTRSRQGKLEKSMISFKANYPKWDMPEGASLTNRIAQQSAAESSITTDHDAPLFRAGHPFARFLAPAQVYVPMSSSIHHLTRPSQVPEVSHMALTSSRLADLAAASIIGAQNRFYDDHSEDVELRSSLEDGAGVGSDDTFDGGGGVVL